MSVLSPPNCGRQILDYLPRYPSKQAVTLPALHLVQDELRCVPLEAIREIADMLDLSPAEVHDTMSFYGFFRDEKNKLGKTRLWVCRSLACACAAARNCWHDLCRSWTSAGRHDGGRQDHGGVRRVHRRLRRGAGGADRRRGPAECHAGQGGCADRGVATRPPKLINAGDDAAEGIGDSDPQRVETSCSWKIISVREVRTRHRRHGEDSSQGPRMTLETSLRFTKGLRRRIRRRLRLDPGTSVRDHHLLPAQQGGRGRIPAARARNRRGLLPGVPGSRAFV